MRIKLINESLIYICNNNSAYMVRVKNIRRISEVIIIEVIRTMLTIKCISFKTCTTSCCINSSNEFRLSRVPFNYIVILYIAKVYINKVTDTCCTNTRINECINMIRVKDIWCISKVTIIKVMRTMLTVKSISINIKVINIRLSYTCINR